MRPWNKNLSYNRQALFACGTLHVPQKSYRTRHTPQCIGQNCPMPTMKFSILGPPMHY